MKALGYIRVSKEEQAISGLGLEDQSTKISLYCDMMGFDLLKTYREESVSGAKPLSERPEGAQLLAHPLLRTNVPVCIVVLKLDRIFRSAGDCLETIESWADRIGFHIIDLGGGSINIRSAYGKFMLTIFAAVAEMERNLICERTKAALAVLKKNGRKTGGNVPYGYDAEENGALVKNENEQAVLQIMQGLKENGDTFESIADLLNSKEIFTKLGKKWTRSSVHRVLS